MNPRRYIIIILLLASVCLLSFGDHLVTQKGKGDGPQITQSEAVLTADKYARVHWTLTEKNLTGYKDNGKFRSNYGMGDRIGMAYKWGGWDTIEDFLEKVEKGYGTGTGGGSNVYSKFSKNDVTGISCTGLVSRAWHLKHKYTLNYGKPLFSREFRKITHDVPDTDLQKNRLDSLKKGDAFINSGHIMLYLYTGRDGRVRVLHSTTPGVIFQAFDVSQLTRNGYKPIRYNNIGETENPPGTVSNPILLKTDKGKQTVEGNTRDVVSMEFDEYAGCSTGSQTGPEVLYRIEIKKAGKIEIGVTDFKDEGIDNDIFLLRSLDANEKHKALDCIAGDDRKIEWNAVPGTYWIVVDSGNDTPGEYSLSFKYSRN
ncbi:hypothetical protein ACFL5P_02665 [candidate division KSB1 bacterium]